MLNDILFNPFIWDREFYKFNRFEKDMNPYSIHAKENGFTLVHNVVGIDKKDLDVSIKEIKNERYLIISGNTKVEETNNEYSVNSKFRLDINKNIKEIKSKLDNGLLYIYITYDKVEDKSQKIVIE